MLKFNSLVLIPSDHCNITCRHCAPECGPTLKHAWDVKLLRQCITDAAELPNLRKSVHFAGGEPFLYYGQMLELARHAHKLKFGISIVTNGFWGKNPERASEMVGSLVEAGLRRVELSTDIFHQEHLPMTVVRETIRVLKSARVHTTLRVITSRKHTVDETLRQLSVEDLAGLEIVGSPVVPVGRAKEAVPEDEYYLTPTAHYGSCHSLLNLTIKADGNVAPCCAGSENTPSLSLGNVYRLPLGLIVRNAEWNFLAKQLFFQGPASFYEALHDAGLGQKVKPDYTNICHICCDLFADPEVVRTLRAWVSERQEHSLAGFLAELEGLDLTNLAGVAPRISPDLVQIASTTS